MMIRVYYDHDALFIDGYRSALIAGTLVATAIGDTISITTINSTKALAAGPYGSFEREDGTGFASVAEALAYFASIFAMQPSYGDSYTETFTSAAPIFGGYAVMFAGSTQVEHADPTSTGYVFAGVATQSASEGAVVVVRRRDITSFSGWAWTSGAPVFALPGGVLTQAPPETGVSHQVGAALDPVTLSIEPRDPVYL